MVLGGGDDIYRCNYENVLLEEANAIVGMTNINIIMDVTTERLFLENINLCIRKISMT